MKLLMLSLLLLPLSLFTTLTPDQELDAILTIKPKIEGLNTGLREIAQQSQELFPALKRRVTTQNKLLDEKDAEIALLIRENRQLTLIAITTSFLVGVLAYEKFSKYFLKG